MRTKDDEKKEALFEATVKLVNEIGFVSSSVSKIAKEAGVSPSTLYIYFANKEDLLVSTYMDIKLDLSEAVLLDFDDARPIRDILRQVWLNSFAFVSKRPECYAYIEQFANAPYMDLVDKDALDKLFEPVILVLHRGIEQKILKNVPLDLMAVFMFPPISHLAKLKRSCLTSTPETDFDAAFDMLWDALAI